MLMVTRNRFHGIRKVQIIKNYQLTYVWYDLGTGSYISVIETTTPVLEIPVFHKLLITYINS